MPRRVPQFTSKFELNLHELPSDDSGAMRWPEIFGESRPLRIEVGVGNSRFLIEVARKAPHFNYLGFEYSKKRVSKFLKKVEGTGITNIRVLPVNICPLLHFAFEPESVEHFYISHPDPWPKRRHAKKRFVSRENVEKMRELLQPGGGISLRTDVRDYANEMLAVLDSTKGLSNLAGRGSFAREPIEPFMTAFEARFAEEGRPIFYLEYRKLDSDGRGLSS